MHYAMMSVSAEDFAISPGSVLEKIRNARDRRRARTGLIGDVTVAEAATQQARNLESFTERLQLTQGGNIPQKIGDIFIVLTAPKRADHGLEPRFPAPAVLCESPFRHANEC